MGIPLATCLLPPRCRALIKPIFLRKKFLLKKLVVFFGNLICAGCAHKTWPRASAIGAINCVQAFGRAAGLRARHVPGWPHCWAFSLSIAWPMAASAVYWRKGPEVRGGRGARWGRCEVGEVRGGR